MLLDTQMWIWLNLNDPKLPVEVSHAVSRLQSRVMLSSISVWEAMLLIEKERVKSIMSPEGTVRFWLENYPFEIVAPSTEIVILSRTLDFTHQDPADRFIAATAIYHKVPLATADHSLRKLQWLDVLPARSETPKKTKA